MIDYRVKTFLEAAKTLNFTKASAALNMTQPAVSQHIRSLETEYGVKLFIHEGKKTCLTRQGKLFYAVASRMSSDDAGLRMQLNRMEESYMSFASTLTVGAYVMPEILSCLLKDNPDLKIRMDVSNTDVVLKSLELGEVDFAVVEGYFDSSRFNHEKLASVRYVAIAPKNLIKKHARLYDLFEYRLLVREKGSGTREVLERYLAERNHGIADFKDVCEIGNPEAIKEMVEKGLGVSFLYEPAVKKERESGLLEVVDLKDFDIRHDFSIVWNQSSIFGERNHELSKKMRESCFHLGL